MNFETVSKLLNKRSNDIFIKKNISLRLFYPFPFLILKILYLRIIFLFSFKKNLNNNISKNKIFIKYQNDILIRYPKAGPLFWTQNSEIDLKDIFIFYEENNLKNEDKKKILSNGLNLLDLRTHTNSFVSITNLLKNYFEVTSWRDLLNDLELATINFTFSGKLNFIRNYF